MTEEYGYAKSPAHPKALMLAEIGLMGQAHGRGMPVVLCRFDANSFIAADAVRVMAVVNLPGDYTTGWEDRRHWIVLDHLPHYLWRSRAARYDMRRRTGAVPPIHHGFAFDPRDLGVLPRDDGTWAACWLMRPTDL